MRGIIARGTIARGIPARIIVVLAVGSGMLACDFTGNATDDAPPALRKALAARTVYPAKREEWRTDITQHVDSTMVPQVLRASQTTVALLQASPARLSIFELNRRGLLLSTRPVRIDPVLNAQVPRDLVAPTELSRVTDDGQVDVIDSARSMLMRESVGGFVFQRDLPMLRGGSGRLCTLSPATLLHVRNLGARQTLEAFRLTAKASEDSLVGRHRMAGPPAQRLRFGSGDARRCLLFAEREVLVVSAPDGPGVGVPPRISPLRAPGSAAPTMIDDLASSGAPDGTSDSTRDSTSDSTRDSTRMLQPIIVDAAVVDGGFVVLVGFTSDRYGRLLDYYDERGEYLQSAWLPFTASAMTGAGPRFVLLHQDGGMHWWMSSWLTPMAARGATAPPEPRQVTRAPGKQLFEPPARAKNP